jgi:hypothetical protein
MNETAVLIIKVFLVILGIASIIVIAFQQRAWTPPMSERQRFIRAILTGCGFGGCVVAIFGYRGLANLNSKDWSNSVQLIPAICLLLPLSVVVMVATYKVFGAIDRMRQ